jgi:hypothetical protein
MKKIISILFVSALLTMSAHAGGMIGIKYGNGDLEGTKDAYTAGSNSYSSQTNSKDHEFGAVFAEVNLANHPVAIGLEYIPYTATISVDGSSSDSHLEISEHTTIYALLSNNVGGGDASAYFKVGYAFADIGGVKANYDQTTVNSHDSSLEGLMIGAGIQSGEFSGMVGRLELTITDYDDVSANTTSNGSTSVTKTADADLTTITISLAKTF